METKLKYTLSKLSKSCYQFLNRKNMEYKTEWFDDSEQTENELYKNFFKGAVIRWAINTDIEITLKHTIDSGILNYQPIILN